MSQGYRRSAFGSASSHGFSKDLISDMVARCHKLFSVEDIIVNVPVFVQGDMLLQYLVF